jgi:hypothetical protein
MKDRMRVAPQLAGRAMALRNGGSYLGEAQCERE